MARMTIGRAVIGGSLVAAALVVAWSCTEIPAPEDEGEIRSSSQADSTLLRARIDADGDGFFDQALVMPSFTFNHMDNIVPFLEAAGVAALHEHLSFDTGTSVVIPAGHPVEPFFDVLQSDEPMAAHGLLVVQYAADAAGLPIPEGVTAQAGADQSVQPGANVTLDGSASTSFVEGVDPAYLWAQTSGSSVELTNADGEQATFDAPAEEAMLEFTLTVTAGDDADSDTVSVTVTSEDDGGDGGGDELLLPDADRGLVAFENQGCGLCHGADATGISAPNLTLAGEEAALLQRFADGAEHFASTMLTAQEIIDVDSWLDWLR